MVLNAERADHPMMSAAVERPASSVATRLKRLRERSGLPMREVAHQLELQTSSYQHYEDRYKKRFLPIEMAHRLARIFEPHGVSAQEVLDLAGLGAGAGLGLQEHEVAFLDAGDADVALAGWLYPGHPHAMVCRAGGRAMDLAGVLAGDFLILDPELDPAPGDIVVAQIYDDEAGNAETVIRAHQPPNLVPRSTDPRATVHSLGDNVRIVGVVTVVWRRRATPP